MRAGVELNIRIFYHLLKRYYSKRAARCYFLSVPGIVDSVKSMQKINRCHEECSGRFEGMGRRCTRTGLMARIKKRCSSGAFRLPSLRDNDIYPNYVITVCSFILFGYLVNANQ